MSTPLQRAELSRTTTTVDVGRLVLDELVYCRAKGIDRETVERYAEAMRDGAEFPPVSVVGLTSGKDKGELLVWDGFHRVEAARLCGRPSLPVEILDGDVRLALVLAAGANTTHGKATNHEDRRLAGERLLKDPEWCQWSDRQIARWTGTSHTSVARWRKELAQAGKTVRPEKVRQYTQRGTMVTLRTVERPPLDPADVNTEAPPAPLALRPHAENRAAMLTVDEASVLQQTMDYIAVWGHPPAAHFVRLNIGLTQEAYTEALTGLARKGFTRTHPQHGYLRVVRNVQGVSVKLAWVPRGES